MEKIKILGYYIKPNRMRPSKGVVYDKQGISPCITDYSAGGNLVPTIIECQTVYKAIIANTGPYKNPNKRILDIAPTLCCNYYSDREPYVIEIYEKLYNNVDMKGKLPKELEGKKFKIRRLTPRECFRLMGVDDKDIDTIQATGISNSAQYKLAGNSIVVDVLYHLFRKMFIETENESQELTLF